MILYHTSTQEIQRPDILHSRSRLDFGKGFYLTSLRDQAVSYGQRFIKRGENAILNVYVFDETRPDCTHKVFASYNDEWLDFVTDCRKNISRNVFDVIEGGIADDQVFNTVDLYFSGIYTREQALDQLLYKKPNHQVCITSQRVLDNYLHFQSSMKLL